MIRRVDGDEPCNTDRAGGSEQCINGCLLYTSKLVVLTGVSGSGKSTLLIDVLFNECQRQYLEAMDLQGIRKPQVENIRGVSPAVCITQRGANRNLSLIHICGAGSAVAKRLRQAPKR